MHSLRRLLPHCLVVAQHSHVMSRRAHAPRPPRSTAASTVAQELGQSLLCSSTASQACDDLLSSLVSGVKYHRLRDVLRVALAAASPSPASFVLDALHDLRTRPSSPDTTLLFHLWLEALACCCAWARPTALALGCARCEQSSERAVVLLSFLVSQPHAFEPRVVLRLAQTFQLRRSDCEQHGLLSACDAYAQSLLYAGSHSPAVLLSLQLGLPSVACEATLPLLISASHAPLAETLAEGLDASAQAQLVRLCLQADLFKAAARAVRRFSLQADFPQAEALYAQSTVLKLCSKGAWEVAAEFANARAPELRALVCQQARLSDEPGIALELAARWKIALPDSEELRVEAEAADAVLREQFWALPADAAMRFVDNHGQPTEAYPLNPNGSLGGLTAVTTADGRFTAMMPHPERVFRNIQLSWRDAAQLDANFYSPWMELWRNARNWVG
jgi:hypothetical protein